MDPYVRKIKFADLEGNVSTKQIRDYSLRDSVIFAYDYGMSEDRVDNEIPINQAITAAIYNKKALVLPSGIYPCTGTIEIKFDVTNGEDRLMIYGNKCELKVFDSVGMRIWSNTYDQYGYANISCSIQDLIISTAEGITYNPNPGIIIGLEDKGVTSGNNGYIRFMNVCVKNYKEGVHLLRSRHVMFTDCDFDVIQTQAVVFDVIGQAGQTVNAIFDIVFTDCYFNGSGLCKCGDSSIPAGYMAVIQDIHFNSCEFMQNKTNIVTYPSAYANFSLGGKCTAREIYINDSTFTAISMSPDTILFSDEGAAVDVNHTPYNSVANVKIDGNSFIGYGAEKSQRAINCNFIDSLYCTNNKIEANGTSVSGIYTGAIFNGYCNNQIVMTNIITCPYDSLLYGGSYICDHNIGTINTQ